MPSIDKVLEDLEYHGGMLDDYLNSIDKSKTRCHHKQILCRIYLMLEDQPQKKAIFERLVEVGETVRVKLAEQTLLSVASGKSDRSIDVQTIKFILQKRMPGKYAIGAKGSQTVGNLINRIEEFKKKVELNRKKNA